MPLVDGLIPILLTEMHSLRYSIHFGTTKMYYDFVAKCRQVKYGYKKPSGTLQIMSIPKQKWEMIAIDFVVGTYKTLGKYNLYGL